MITIEMAEDLGYYACKPLMFQGKQVMAGLRRFAFTVGLVFGIDETGYYGRYCFAEDYTARLALENISEIPSDLLLENPDWIKYKGYGGDISNPLKEAV